MTTTPQPKALELSDKLLQMDDAKKSYPSGPCGQMLGLEQYRLVASGFAFASLYEAAALLRTQHAELEALRRWKSIHGPRMEATDGLLHAAQVEAAAGHEAVTSLASERAANALLTSELEDLRKEVERLTACLKTANAQAEHFEREWYLRGDEVERLREDAERLDWLSDIALSMDAVSDPDSFTQVHFGTDPCRTAYGRTLRAAIDAARGAKG